MLIIIKTADSRDIEALSELAKRSYSHAFGHTMKSESLSKYLKTNCSEAYFENTLKNDVILTAETQGQLVGYVKFGNPGFEFEGITEQDQELQRLYVDPDFKRKGIGKALLQASLDNSRLSSAKRIYLKVNPHNKAAITLYENFGFQIVGKTVFTIDSQVIGQDLVMARISGCFPETV